MILASRSTARQQLLRAAGLPFEGVPSAVDERDVQSRLSGTAATGSNVALVLAEAKARSVAAMHKGRLVLGADQTLTLGEEIFSKPVDRGATARQLRRLAGRTHVLHSAAAVVVDDHVVFSTVGLARLTMRHFGEAFVEGYLDAAGPVAFTSVGGYQIEGIGIHLFESIEGDHATILGLPLMPLLEFLGDRGSILR